MGHKYTLDFDGQSVTQDDYNGLGLEAGTADDKVLAELFRLTPDSGSVARGILPYAHASSGLTPLISANGASGSIKINPFRAIIGTRTVEATDAALCWQDTRSGISIADGASTLATTLSISANSSGNPRWDAVYATVTIDDPSTPVTRKVKNPATSVVTDESVSVSQMATVTTALVVGTPGASPAFPVIPSDGGSIYYVLLGYVRVPNGFGAGSTVDPLDINTTAPVISISRAMGVSTLQPANQNYKSGGTAISGAGTSTPNGAMAWSGTAATRAAAYMPPTMQGGDSRLVAIDVSHASSANWSHQNGDIVDDSCDWRNRLWSWVACAGLIGTFGAVFPWKHPTGSSLALMCPFVPATPYAPMPGYSTGIPPATASGVGVSVTVNSTHGTVAMLCATGAATAATPAAGSNMCTNIMTSGTAVYLYADTSTGALKIGITGVPGCSIVFWLNASAPYENI